MILSSGSLLHSLTVQWMSFSCFDKLFNVRVCEVCSVTYMQAPVIQSIRCPVEPAVNSSQAPNRGSSDDRDTFASPCFAYFSGDETP